MSQISDPTMIHDRVAELARANVMRMRGNYAQARQVCNLILNAYPEDVETYALMAEICTDEGDLETAAHWYDMARDKDPGNTKMQVRAQMLRDRINSGNQRQVTQNLQAMQVPTVANSQKKAWGLVAFLGVAVVGTLLALWLTSPKKPAQATTVTNPIKVPAASTPTAKSGSLASNNPASPSTPAAAEKTDPFDYALPTKAPEEGKIAEDEQAMTFFQQRCADGDRIIMIQQQPSNKELNVTFKLDPKDEPQFLAARIATDILKNSTKAPKVNLRAVLDRNVTFAAEASRKDFNDLIENGQFDVHNPDPELLLKNVWIKHPEDENGPAKG